jgi:hypothetical protein
MSNSSRSTSCRSAGVDEGVEGSRRGLAQPGFQLGEPLLDRVEIGAVGRQVQQTGFGAFDGRSDACDLVARQIVQHHDIAGLEFRNQELLDPSAELLAVDRPVEGARRDETVLPQRSDEGGGFPMTPRNRRDEALAARASAVEPRHFGRCAGFVDKDQVVRSPFGLLRPPLLARLRNVGAVLLCGALRLFLSVNPR